MNEEDLIITKKVRCIKDEYVLETDPKEIER